MDLVFTTRTKAANGRFTSNASQLTRYLKVPAGTAWPTATHIASRDDWMAEVRAQARADEVLINIHGFNTNQRGMISRHDHVRDGLAAQGYQGAVVSFDWPSNGSFLDYRQDRADALAVAGQFVFDGVAELIRAFPGWKIHVLAHSMGCLVVRHGFHRVDLSGLPGLPDWRVNQVIFVAGDVSASSMSAGHDKSRALFARCDRLTNYYSGADEVLSMSNIVYWHWAHPRAGFAGLPAQQPANSSDLYCMRYYADHVTSLPDLDWKSHRWYFRDPTFFADARQVLAGTADNAINTRAPTTTGGQALWG